jgi:hypothetical protein
MLRLLFSVAVVLFAVSVEIAGDNKTPKPGDFAQDCKLLTGEWDSPSLVITTKKLKGRIHLELALNGEQRKGLALMYCTPDGAAGAQLLADEFFVELKAAGKKRVMVLSIGEARVVVAELTYEVTKDKLAVACTKHLKVKEFEIPIDLSGEWLRAPEGKKEKK